MNLNVKIVIIALCLSTIAVPTDAYPGGAAPGAVKFLLQDSENAKSKLYSGFKKGTTGDQKERSLAYETGKEFLQKFPDEKDPRAKEIKDWIILYEADMRAQPVLISVYKDMKYAEAFQQGKQLLVTDQENLKVVIALGYAGMPAAATGNSDLTTDSIVYANKAIRLIEDGKAPIDWKPLKSRDDTLGWLNYSLGVMVLRSSPSDSIGYLTRAAQLEGAPKRDPVVYYYLAVLYGQEFEKQRTAYKNAYEGKPETPESKVALEKVGSVVDLIIDAYARAISYTDASPQLKQTYQQQEIDWVKKLSELYRSRHNGSDAGLKELISGIQSKPLPGQQSSLVPMAMP